MMSAPKPQPTPWAELRDAAYVKAEQAYADLTAAASRQEEADAVYDAALAYARAQKRAWTRYDGLAQIEAAKAAAKADGAAR